MLGQLRARLRHHRKAAFRLGGLLAVLAIAAAAVVPAFAFPTQSNVYNTFNGCQTSQTAPASIDSGEYKLAAWHEDYLGCAQLVYSQARINDGTQIIHGDMVGDPTFAEPSSLYASYYYYGYGWGKAQVSGFTSSEWGTLSVAP